MVTSGPLTATNVAVQVVDLLFASGCRDLNPGPLDPQVLPPKRYSTGRLTRLGATERVTVKRGSRNTYETPWYIGQDRDFEFNASGLNSQLTGGDFPNSLAAFQADLGHTPLAGVTAWWLLAEAGVVVAVVTTTTVRRKRRRSSEIPLPESSQSPAPDRELLLELTERPS